MSRKFNAKDLEIVDASEIPETRFRRGFNWEEIFGAIPRGKAVIIQPEQIASSTVRSALKRKQEEGKFKNLYMTTRRKSDRKYISYVINPSRKPQPEESP